MFYRLFFVLALAAWTSPTMGQGVQWGLGTDPSMWLSGWHHVQVGAQLHPEISVLAGFGWMDTESGILGSAMRQRPGDFDGAFTGNFGVRLHPSSKAGGRLQGLLGLDYSHEVFNENASGSSGLITEVEVPFGVRQYIRNDIRLLAGGRVHVAQQLTLSVHVGVGYSRQHEALPSQTNLGRQTSPKLLGMELLYWL